ncbi:hypothetical protein CTEN210_02025 [Chaetoceros tenuissimus]|uniref:Uncharacterized protein n=1 Tax=Chaetoceros tenuissimus TaxID=426638 RepID=A0AAD3CGT0_9STRA|nr:hypothetical protein CTEN210_02025 [Chaetoceros tenuissimus]
MDISLHSHGKDLNGDDFIDSPEARMAMYEKMKNLVGLPSTPSSPGKTATSDSSAADDKENVKQYNSSKSPSENIKSFASAAPSRKVSFDQDTKTQTKKTGGGILKNSSTGKKLPKNAAEIRKSLVEAESRIGRAKLVEKEMSFRGLKDVDDTGHKDEKNLWSDEALNERKPTSELMHRARSLRSFSMRKLNVVKEDDDEEEAPSRPELPTSKSFARAPPRRGFNHRDSMEMMEQTGHSVSFYKPRVVDHFDLKADISPSPSKETKGVTFSVVEVKEYPYTIGSNPSVSGGIPLTVEWDSSHFVQVPIDEHERIRVPERRNMVELKIPKDIRIDMLLNAGHTIKEISSEIKKNDKLRFEKLETKQTLYKMPKEEKWERIRRAFSSCFTSRKKKERDFMERAYSFSY